MPTRYPATVSPSLAARERRADKARAQRDRRQVAAEPVKPHEAVSAPDYLATLRAERARIAAVLDALRFTPRAINGNVRGHLADTLAPLYAAIEAADAQIRAAEESAAINPT